ncbi:MAG: hypothetical protein ACI97A_001671 [Planctomycetota bacterium]|jgi:hypothetical protein
MNNKKKNSSCLPVFLILVVVLIPVLAFLFSYLVGQSIPD